MASFSFLFAVAATLLLLLVVGAPASAEVAVSVTADVPLYALWSGLTSTFVNISTIDASTGMGPHSILALSFTRLYSILFLRRSAGAAALHDHGVGYVFPRHSSSGPPRQATLCSFAQRGRTPPHTSSGCMNTYTSVPGLTLVCETSVETGDGAGRVRRVQGVYWAGDAGDDHQDRRNLRHGPALRSCWRSGVGHWHRHTFVFPLMAHATSSERMVGIDNSFRATLDKRATGVWVELVDLSAGGTSKRVATVPGGLVPAASGTRILLCDRARALFP